MRSPTSGETEDRRTAVRRGRRGEGLALWWLRLKGYRIVARDLRSPLGEIDIVACRGRVLAVIEVKARDSLRGAAEAVTPRQRERIGRAARLFIGRRPVFASHRIRFDVMLVAPGRWPRHIVDAWQEDGAH